MKNLALAVALLLAAPALAGEVYLGAIVSGAGADTTNATTAAPFKVSAGSKLTLHCTAAALVCTDTSSACTVLGGAQPGVPVSALTNFPTSVKATSGAPTVTISGATSSIVRIVGAAAVTCYVWVREGNE
jgi:hypothetical protein